MCRPMYSILVVDDDPIIRQEICGFIEEYQRETGTGLVTYQAENGQKAVEAVCARPIDIIFSDVKMPLLTGTQMMERLRGLGYAGQIVIISGFEDYSLIRSAMRLGAADYLLKPIAQEEFRVILRECLEQAAQKGRQEPESARTLTEDLYQNQHYIDLLLAGSPDAAPCLPHGTGLLCLADLFRERNPEEGRRKAAFLQMNALARELFEEPRLWQGVYRGLWAVVLAAPSTAEAAQALRQALKREKLRCGCCDRAVPLGELPAALSQCLDRLNRYFYDVPDLLAAVKEPFPYEGLMKQLASAICACDFIQFSGFLAQLFSTLCRDKPPLEDARRLLSSLLYRVMSQNNDFISVVGQYKFTENDLVPYMEETSSAMELRRRMMEIFHLYMEAVQEKRLGRDSYNVTKAKQFLEREYQNDVSLTEISERLGIHPNYLSTLFKAETGITFSQYLRSLRVRKASELLRDTNLKIYQVAEQVGYSDTASFYRVFKEELGVSPAQYKKSLPEK